MTPSRWLGRRSVVLAVALVSTALACKRSPYPPPPPTQQVAVVDTLHGVAFTDPYRWLEQQTSDPVRAWVAAQNAYADSIVGNTPSRREIARRLRELYGGPTIGAPRPAGRWEYFTLRRSGEDVAAIYRRPKPAHPTPIDPSGRYQKIVDPLAIRSDGTTSVGIEGFSPDGRLMLYSVRDGGPDEITVHVRNLAAGKDLPDSLPWALYDETEFDHAGRGFYYVQRSRQTGPRLKYHRLGAPVPRDTVVFGEGYGPTTFLNVDFPENGRWRVYTVGYGWARNDVLLQDMSRGGTLIPIAQGIPAHFEPQWVDGRLRMRTDLDAPKGRIVTVDPRKPAQRDWRTLIPEAQDVLDRYARIGDRVYVTYLHDVGDQIRVPAGDLPAGPALGPRRWPLVEPGRGRGRPRAGFLAADGGPGDPLGALERGQHPLRRHR
jgi:prolyl oligopeptidase